MISEISSEGYAGRRCARVEAMLPLAIAFERASGDQKLLLERIWRRTVAVTDEAAIRN